MAVIFIMPFISMLPCKLCFPNVDSKGVPTCSPTTLTYQGVQELEFPGMYIMALEIFNEKETLQRAPCVQGLVPLPGSHSSLGLGALHQVLAAMLHDKKQNKIILAPDAKGVVHWA